MNAEMTNIEMTAAETAFIDGFVRERCVPHDVVVSQRLEKWCDRMQSRIFEEPIEWRLASASGSLPELGPKGGKKTPKSPEENIRFVFASVCDEPGKAWRAELRIPPGATLGTMLPVKVTGIGSDPVPEGVLALAGCKIPLVDGEGGILFDLFVGGIRSSQVYLLRTNGMPVPGKLMFM